MNLDERMKSAGRDSIRCVIEERNRLRGALQRIADHHEHQRVVWSIEGGDADQAEYHEERRNFALYHLKLNLGDLEQSAEDAEPKEIPLYFTDEGAAP